MSNLSLKAVVLSVSFLMMSGTAPSPAIANIMAAFPSTNPSTIMWIITLPSIVMVIFSLLYGKLVQSVNKRTLAMTGFLCLLLGGIAPAFLNDINLILTMRAVFGIGMGFLTPLSYDLIAGFFSGHEREKMMGLQSAVVNFGGLVFQLIGGFLAAVNWHNTFYVYLLGLLIGAWVFLKLPEPERVKQTSTEKVKLPKKVYIVVAEMTLYSLLIFAFMANISLVIVNEGIGNAAKAGIVLTIFGLGGLLAGLLFGKLVQIFKRFTTAFGLIATGLGLSVIASVNDFNLIMLGAFIAGTGLATTMPSYFNLLAAVSPPSGIGMSFALSTSFMGIGQFISPVVFEYVAKLFGQELGRFPILVSAIAIFVMGLYIVLISLKPSNLANSSRETTA